MDQLYQREMNAARLAEITQRIGFAIWQLQELESVSAQYFVLKAQAEIGMGQQAWDELETKAQKKTFGHTIHRMKEAGLLTPEDERRYRNLLAERNWLVHGSKADSRGAVYGDAAMIELMNRLDRIAEDALQLLREVGESLESHVKKHGVSAEYIEKTSKELLKKWREPDDI